MTSVTRRLFWPAYTAFWAGVGLFFSLAEWQHYMRGGGRHPWEPFLWEMSGAMTTAPRAAQRWTASVSTTAPAGAGRVCATGCRRAIP